MTHISGGSRRKQHGFLLVSLLVTTFLTVAVAIATADLVVSSYKLSQRQHYTVNAQLVTDAGVDHAIDQLNANGSWTGSGGEQTLIDNGSIKLTYTSTLVNGADAEHKVLTVTGRAYKSGSMTPTDTRKAEIGLQGAGGSGVGGDVAAYAGVGGLDMTGTSSVTGGQVFVNGGVDINQSASIGSAGTPVNVRAANQNCPVPANATYPRLCTGADGQPQPISLEFSSRIDGEVRGNNQTTGTGMFTPGLVAGTVDPSPLPSHDRTSVTNPTGSPSQTIQTGTAAGCGGVTNKTWPANLRINGNVVINGSCNVTVAGNVWITGNLTVTGTGRLIVANGLTEQPNIVVDGSAGVIVNQGAVLQSNTATPDPIGFRVVTYYSTAACSISTPTACDVSGVDLFNSQSDVTILIDGTIQAPNTQFYSRWTAVQMNGTAAVGALVGQKISLLGDASINFGVSIDEDESGTLSWSIESYKRVYN